MRILNVLFAAGVSRFVTATSAPESTTDSVTSQYINLDSRALSRRTLGEKYATISTDRAPGNRDSPKRDRPSQQASQGSSSRQQAKTKTPTPRTPSPSPSSDRRVTSPRASMRDKGRGANTRERSPIRSLFPSPPPQERFERINPYVAMLGVGRSSMPQSTPGMNRGKMSVPQLQAAQNARRDARSARRLATQKYLTAQQISDTRRANSPTTKAAVGESIRASNSAIIAMRTAAQAQARSGAGLVGTVGSYAVDTRLESGARRLARADQLEALNIAFEAQQDARKQAETIPTTPPGYPQLRAIQYTAIMQKNARVQADTYYRDHEDYRKLKNQIPGDSSSSDEERELTDYPKTWSPSTRRTNRS